MFTEAKAKGILGAPSCNRHEDNQLDDETLSIVLEMCPSTASSMRLSIDFVPRIEAVR